MEQKFKIKNYLLSSNSNLKSVLKGSCNVNNDLKNLAYTEEKLNLNKIKIIKILSLSYFLLYLRNFTKTLKIYLLNRLKIIMIFIYIFLETIIPIIYQKRKFFKKSSNILNLKILEAQIIQFLV